MRQTNLLCLLPAALLVAAMGLPACQNAGSIGASSGQQVPYPVSLMLPKSIHIHPFTGMRAFDEQGGVKGIDARIEAKDAAGDTTRAFGDFRFELYTFRPNSLDPKDKLIASWNLPLLAPMDNQVHWDGITRTYKFKLQWDQPIPVGQQFVLVAVFSSPFTERLFSERVFVSGQ